MGSYYKIFDHNKVQGSNVFSLWFRRYAPFDEFGAIGFRFEGDRRTRASSSPKVTSRTYACLFFTTSEVIYGFAGSSGTTWVGYAPWTSSVPGPRILSEVLNKDLKGTTAHAEVSLTVVERMRSSIIEIEASTAGAMPLLPGSPNIDTKVKVRCDFGRPGNLNIVGEAFGDDFPNLEVFLNSQSGNAAILLDGQTTGWQDTGPMTRLLGSHSDQSLGTFNVHLQLNDKGQLATNYTAPQKTM